MPCVLFGCHDGGRYIPYSSLQGQDSWYSESFIMEKKNYNGPRKKLRIPVVRCEPGLPTPATSKTTVLQVLLATGAQKAIGTRLFVKQHTALQLIGDGETKAKHIGKQFPQHFFAE